MSRELSRRAFLTGRPAKPAAGTAVAILSRDTCLAWTGVICISCRTACTVKAIELDKGGRPVVVEDPCTGCGDCVPVCPTEAIVVR